MLHRGFKHSVMKSKLDALLKVHGVENNQVLIRRYELIDADFEYIGGSHHDERGGIIDIFVYEISTRAR